MHFTLLNHKIELMVEDKVYYTLQRYQAQSVFTRESGGMLIGELNPAKKQIIITDMTTPQKKDKSTFNRFIRSEYGHQDIMDKLWKESGYKKMYLGEWHTHNQNVPVPSCVDLRNWSSISNRPQNSDYMFFCIVGKQEIKFWCVHEKRIFEMNANVS